MFIESIKFFNSSITVANWWSHSVKKLLINFKTSVLLLKWRILEYICSYWWDILNTTMMIVLVFSQIFHKELLTCTQTFRTEHLTKNTTKSTFTSIIRLPEIVSFLLGDSSSIPSTLDEDMESVWKTENVSIFIANVAVAVSATTLIMYRYWNCHFFIHYLQLRN